MRTVRAVRWALASLLGLFSPFDQLGCPPAAAAAVTQDPASPAPRTTFEESVKGARRIDGLLELYLDADRGRVLLALTPPRNGGRNFGEYLYVDGLVSGLGSNPVGLDRGQLGTSRLVRMRRAGARLFIEQRNLRFRADRAADAERRAVEESFASSILWGGDILARHDDGRLLVDLTSFLLRDAHGISATLKRRGQGDFSLDPQRSAVELEECLAFPDNVELEVLLTYFGQEPGPDVRRIAPQPRAITFRQHHSFIRLPDDGYQPRPADPRVGYITSDYLDYSAALADSLDRSLIHRHRLEKTDPTRSRSTVHEPIVYHVDPGTPEPVRGALIEGASWWAEAFDAAGFVDAFRVELLPDGAHPLDVRYNVIQWVHRSTRGWSYGGSIHDPRSGEIIKGHVSLGSLRVRQDRLLFEGLLGTDRTGSGVADDPVELALARIRQLAAHEVGHTLGLSHNFAASTYAGRASVMDYPAPLIGIDADGNLDLSAAYDVGLGAYDLHAIRYGYSQFAESDDQDAALLSIVRDGLEQGLLFVSDDHSRPGSAAHALGHLWDNGADPVAELAHAMRVREIGLSRFGARNVTPGTPLSRLEEVLAPLYLHHRYQIDAAAKKLGGASWSYDLRQPTGPQQPAVRPVSGPEQLEALEALLRCLEPRHLDLPEAVLGLLTPRPRNAERTREMFRGRTGPLFDSLGAAEALVDSVLATVLHPARCARLVDQHRRDPSLPGLTQILDRLINRIFTESARSTPRWAELHRLVQDRLLSRLLLLVRHDQSSPAVRSAVHGALESLILRSDDSPHGHRIAHRVRAYLDNRDVPPATTQPTLDLPPGSPIGSDPYTNCSTRSN